jgi:hypothetical protein
MQLLKNTINQLLHHNQKLPIESVIQQTGVVAEFD